MPTGSIPQQAPTPKGPSNGPQRRKARRTGRLERPSGRDRSPAHAGPSARTEFVRLRTRRTSTYRRAPIHPPAPAMSSTNPSPIDRRRQEAREELKARSGPWPSPPGPSPLDLPPPGHEAPLGPATRDACELTDPPVGKGLTTAVLSASAITIVVIALLFTFSPTP